jgi:hypothetical protein
VIVVDEIDEKYEQEEMRKCRDCRWMPFCIREKGDFNFAGNCKWDSKHSHYERWTNDIKGPIDK